VAVWGWVVGCGGRPPHPHPPTPQPPIPNPQKNDKKYNQK